MKEQFDLAKWLAGEMTEAELKAFEASAEFPDYERIRRHSGNLSAPDFNADEMYRQILERRNRKVRTIPLFRKWIAAAAVIVVLLGTVFLFRSLTPVTVTAGNGEQITFLLPDDSKVTLNAGSEISYTRWDWDNHRKLDLSGEAYFRVAKGKKFAVKTTLGKVTVLGTQFNVKSRGDRFDVTCYEGRVRVDYANTATVITHGQSVSFDDGTQLPTAAVVVPAPEWTADELVFNRESLNDIIDELNRQYNFTITSNVQANQLFTGTLPLKNISQALEIICETYHLKASQSGRKIQLDAVNGPQ